LIQQFDVRTEISMYHKVKGKTAGHDRDGLERDGSGRPGATPRGRPSHRSQCVGQPGSLHDNREETPMKNGSETCLTTFGRKTQLVDRTAPAAALLSLETTPLPVYGTAGQQFHATVPMISSANDIDILNIMPTGASTFLPNN
jgi:hypothetical protein